MTGDSDLARLLERGLAQQRAGQHKAAIQSLHRVAERGGASAAVLCRLGQSYEQLGNFQRADDCYVEAIERDPKLSEPYLRAADLALRASGLAARVGQTATARDLRAGALQYLNSLGARLTQRGAWREAEGAFLKARTIAPEAWGVHVDLGLCLYQTQRHRDAEQSIREGVRLAPHQAQAHFHLGVVLLRQGRASEAEAALRQALALDPSFASAEAVLGDALRFQRRVSPAEALGSSEAAMPFTERGLHLLGLVYDETIASVIAEHHRAWGESAIAAIRPSAADSAPFPNTRDPARRLRVGYVSPDFKSHSVAYFIEPLLASHDRNAVETFCYAEVAQPDETTERLAGLTAHWRSTVGVDDESFRRQVRADGIDILIDLAGHTNGNRLAAFAVRPAPVTASWLGYPTTTGLATIDWRITDAVADPAHADSQYVERLIRLDGPFLCFRPPDEAPDLAPPPAQAAGRITFGSFNNLLKMPPAVTAWSEILHAVPESRLLLKALALRDPAAQQRMRELFAAAGVAASRLDLRGATNDRAAHLATYGDVDIALDTFPYNGTATTCEALWMGVPVVALAGDRHSGRVGQSLLGSVGLADLVQPDRTAYIDCAIRLSGDVAALAERRANLRRQVAASPLCDGPNFARAFEAALRLMWAKWCEAIPADRPDVV